MENELVVRRADPRLRRYIDRYYGYAEQTAGPVRQREPPSTGVVLIFGLGPELKLVDRADPTRPPMRLGSFVAGLDEGCAVIEHDGEMRGVQVDVTPLAARMIFRVPMHALARQTVALEDVLDREARRLEERLVDARTWAERFELVEAALSARLAAAEPPPPDVDWAWRRLTATHGRIRIAELAAELGCSRKHLAARFREHVGLPPKLFARMLRFGHAVDLMGSAPRTSLAQLAVDCGYYDQAHLDRDFRDFAATTPTAYFADPRSKVTFVQDAAAGAS
jgi:AraC-like DNA-binding protein